MSNSPGWHCDGCGDYLEHDGKQSFSVAQHDLRAQVQKLEAALHDIIAADCCGCAVYGSIAGRALGYDMSDMRKFWEDYKRPAELPPYE